MHATTPENVIVKHRNVLVVLYEQDEIHAKLRALMNDFCGIVLSDFSTLPESDLLRVFVCGDLSRLPDNYPEIHVIREYATGTEFLSAEVKQVHEGQVPILVHQAGVYYRRLFDDTDLFHRVKSEHTFQKLTESNKESKSFRKGIYLTEIVKEAHAPEEKLHFRLLRCSSNLTGPTDNFRETDHHLMRTLNAVTAFDFETETSLNHVLVQIYENASNGQKETKSKIKAHSDKTKDMPGNGLIAFCTFYDISENLSLKPSETDDFDLCYKQTSALTRLHFKLKPTVKDASLVTEFSVTLYPNSVFLIPLSTNRLYTHEIKPSVLGIDKIPVRMGYVARCSNVEAVYTEGQTYLIENGQQVKLEPMTPEMMTQLRQSYYEENTSENRIQYGKIHFSMNAGDYERPNY